MFKLLYSTDQIKAALENYAGTENTSDFDLNNALRPVDPKLRDAAVLIPITSSPDGLNVILTKRSNNLKHHPGQIALPGGKVEKSDKDVIETALREAYEEIGLLKNNVEILGILPKHQTITNFCITPVIGLIKNSYEPKIEFGEVDEIFKIPFKLFINPNNFQIHYRIWNNQNRGYYSVPYGPYYIWGATARIMKMFCKILSETNENKQ
ncbi:CoA pyrophosphatase [Amylibacter sp.]|nr:CoA pyrophosphatase [Amylibacter sp.]